MDGFITKKTEIGRNKYCELLIVIAKQANCYFEGKNGNRRGGDAMKVDGVIVGNHPFHDPEQICFCEI